MIKISLISGLLISSAFLYFSWISLKENEKLAAGRALGLGSLILLLYLVNFFWHHEYQLLFSIILILLPVIPVILFFIPVRKRAFKPDEDPNEQIDERDIMFSRKLYEPGTSRYEEYYTDKPDKKAADDNFRKLPGLLSERSSLYNPFTYDTATSIFKVIKGMQRQVDGDVNPIKSDVDPKQISALFKNWLITEGCVSSGITELYDYHYYSYVGRGTDFGKKVTIRHKYGVVFTVEMRKEMVDCAPNGPSVMESAQQYLNAATKAIQLSQMIRDMGYDSRAHIDGNYHLVCPLVARDAGLGDIGRMGILMTPELGPRVRIGVVTTDLPLIPDRRRPNPSMIQFCESCKKCAVVCPSNAISFDDRQDINGVHRWQINQEACYTLWCKLGTDCGRCMAVCPYSHPNSFMHSVIRRGIKNSMLFSRLALRMDDFFYGKKPVPKTTPGWLNLQ